MKKLYLGAFTLLATIAGFANNLQISNITNNVSTQSVSFNISWENSWNTTNNINPLYPNNWDGAWVFIKYQTQADNLWKHLKVSNSAADHTVTGGILQADAVSDSMGVFLRRSNPGSGTSSAAVTLRIASVPAGTYNLKVFGIEMVNCPTDTFHLGDGSVSGTSYLSPLTITAARQASGFAAGALYSGSPVIPPAFPTGYNNFYIMKYEASNEQYCDYLNTLTYDQQAERIDAVPSQATGTNAFTVSVTVQGIVEIMTPGVNNTQPAVFACDFTEDNTFNTTNDGQNLPFSGVSKGDVLAYLDWSGLRPLTELEYEKAARGPRPRVQSEYAWGSTNIVCRARPTLTNGGQANEFFNAAAVNGMCMCNSGTVTHGPARNGVFATTTSGRESSGASFYGVMELSGNMWEMLVHAGTGGTNFTGLNGDGKLTTLGAADVANWPDATSSTGIMIRGGSWWETSSFNAYTMVSYRGGQAAATRAFAYGLRGGRNL